MDGGRRGSSRAIAGLSSAFSGCIALAAVACGDAFTTAPSGGDGGGGVDAMVSPDTGGDAGKGWCASQAAAHTLCEDFTSGVPGMLLTAVTMSGGTLEADTTDFTSPPASLLASTLSSSTVGDTAMAIVTKTFSSAVGTHFVLSLDLRIDSAACLPKNDKNGVLVLALNFTNYEVAIQILPNEVDVVEISGQIPTAAHPSQLTLPSGWARWTLDVQGISNTLDLTVGSTAVFKKQALQNVLLPLQHPQLVLGAVVKNNADQAPACKVRIDNILFDVRMAGAPIPN